ncbi:MAG: DUF5131 family protein [Clostridiales bacterium]|nr:DUF5131 family protein [Clostridiales bacterium]
MHDIWNPWHGCIKCSEGCEHCYMYYLDRVRDQDGSAIYRTRSGFDYPLQRDRRGNYKVRSGETLRVCMTSDFFLAEADPWREDAWEMIRQRPDVCFYLLTKRPERVADCLPEDWGDGWENVFFNVTCENQRRADERIPLLLSLPFRHKGIMCAPFIGPVRIGRYLEDGQIRRVVCGGENYDGCRPCHFDWVLDLRRDCVEHGVTFCFIETGTLFIKDGKQYRLPNKRLQSRMAYRSGVGYAGAPIHFALTDRWGLPIPEQERYRPWFGPACQECGQRMICNGCSRCGACGIPLDGSGPAELR